MTKSTQPDISNLFGGKFRLSSFERPMLILTAFGINAEAVVRAVARSKKTEGIKFRREAALI